MESADLRVRLYGNTAVVTGLTTTKGKFMERGLHVVRTGNRYFCEAKRPLAMRIHAANSIHQKVKQRQRTLKLAQYRCVRRVRLTMRWS